MPAALVHLETPTPRAACGTLPVYWSRDPLAITCPRCISIMEAQPA